MAQTKSLCYDTATVAGGFLCGRNSAASARRRKNTYKEND